MQIDFSSHYANVVLILFTPRIGEKMPNEENDLSSNVYTLTRDIVAYTNVEAWIIATITWVISLVIALWLIERLIISIYELTSAIHTGAVSVAAFRVISLLRWALALGVMIALIYNLLL
jgi:hypothetical protein